MLQDVILFVARYQKARIRGKHTLSFLRVIFSQKIALRENRVSERPCTIASRPYRVVQSMDLMSFRGKTETVLCVDDQISSRLSPRQI